MKHIAAVVVLSFLLVGCGGGSSGGGSTQGEAVQVVLSAVQSAAPATPPYTAAPVTATVTFSAKATNVGAVPVRGIILTHYDGGAGTTPGAHNLLVCQKCFGLKDGSGPGGCNYIFHVYEEENADISVCQQGFYEHYYMDPGEGYCDNAAENPELDCSKPATWRVLTVPIFGYAGGGGKLNPGQEMTAGGSYDLPIGTYTPSASVYRWDGTAFDNDTKTITIE